MKTVSIIFPHQLFENSPLLAFDGVVYLIEEFLFFKQYAFHKQKIAYHRATMKFYQNFLQEKGCQVNYISAHQEAADVRNLIPQLQALGCEEINYIDVTDDWLSRHLEETCNTCSIKLSAQTSPLFINKKDELQPFFRSDKKKYHQTSFYKDERQKRKILLDNADKPTGGKWTFDAENRKKYPAKKIPPAIHYPSNDEYYKEAVRYVDTHFNSNLGALTNQPLYPTNFSDSRDWLNQFFENRFREFGPYEDAIVAEYDILNHSVLTPMLNIGLLTPNFIIESALRYANKHTIPINSLEGFIRQIMGWREFIRGIYENRGRDERTRNFWGFNKPIPPSFYNGTTGIKPVDDTIKKILKTGYCHHIERLMILGNFMLLCEFHPNAVYQWFMELFIDAYDWVMVPNVYGMSQFADGGLMASKPYISGSNYIIKMSNYKKGDTWQATWDGLFWKFMDKHRDFFIKNPRLAMLIKNFDNMSVEKKETHLSHANKYLESLDHQQQN